MDYAAPTSLDDALQALRSGEVSVIAGGTDWFPTRGEVPAPVAMMDVTRIAGLRGIERSESGWRIGAATRWSDILRADLPSCFDGLKAAAREVGSVQIQNAGTVAGNLCNASPAADGVPPLLALDAKVELASLRGRRVLPLADFITGVRQTARERDELVTALHVPALPEQTVSGFIKAGARKYLVISVAMVAVVIVLESGRVTDARIAVGACSPVARRLPDLEEALLGAEAGAAARCVEAAHLRQLSPISDLRGAAQYRSEAVVELCRRAIAMAVRGRGV